MSARAFPLARSGSMALAVLALAGVFSVLGCAAHPQAALPPAARTAMLLAINDVYRIEGAEEGKAGGLARVRALRRELEREQPGLLVLHAGDLLYPSFASRTYNGEQMIAVLDQLDGSDAFDPRMFVTFGNHEFEKRKKKDAGILAQRVAESQFRWLGGNVSFAPGNDGRPLVAAENVLRSAVVESGGIRIGLFGLTIPTLGVEYAEFAGPDAAARELTAKLRREGAEVVVAVTHLNAADDRALLEQLGGDGPDLIVGGHDHEKMAFQANGRWVIKADADARTASVIRLRLDRAGHLDVTSEHRPLAAGGAPSPDRAVQSLVERWQERHAREFCAAQKPPAPADCLSVVYGHTRTLLEAEENKIRGRETSLGDWVADRMLETFAPCGAQVAFLNAGTLRLNQDLEPGSTLARRQVEELFGFPSPLRLIRIDPAILQETAEQAVRGWPGSGTWLQIAGFAFVHDQEAKAAHGLTLLDPAGARAPRDGESILAVTNDYLINPDAGDRDGYDFLPTEEVPGCPASGRDLKEVVVEALRKAEPDGIAPATEGRICQPGTACRAVGR